MPTQVQTELITDASITAAKLAAGAALANLANASVTPGKLTQPLTSASAIATTSGTDRDFGSIPNWVRRIRLMLNGVSLSGTALIRFRLGTSGGIVTSGYLGAGSVFSSGAATVNQTAGFDIYTNVPNASYVYHGVIDFSLLDSANNIWTAHGVFASSSVTWTHTVAGVVPLASALTTVRLTTSNGTDTFDAGSANIFYD